MAYIIIASILLVILFPLIQFFRKEIASNSEQSENKKVVSKVVDSNGGKLQIKNTQITLVIPSGAVSERKQTSISLAVDFGSVATSDNSVTIAPVVDCGPTGTVFNKACSLIIPHDAVNKDEWEFTCYTRKSPQDAWNELDDKNTIFTVEDGKFIIETNYFTGYNMRGKPKTTKNKNEIKFSLCMFGKMMEKYYLLRVRLWRQNFYSDEGIIKEETEMGMKKLSLVHHEINLSLKDSKIELVKIADEWQKEPKKIQINVAKIRSHTNIPFEFLLIPKSRKSLKHLDLGVNLSQGGQTIASCHLHDMYKEQEPIVEPKPLAWWLKWIIVSALVVGHVVLMEKYGKLGIIDKHTTFYSGLCIKLTVVLFLIILSIWFYCYCHISENLKCVGTMIGYIFFSLFFDIAKTDIEINTKNIITFVPLIYALYLNKNNNFK